MKKQLSYYIKRAYENAKNKGFHKQDDEIRDSFQFHDEKHAHVCRVLMLKDINLIMTELSEAVEFIRKDEFACLRSDENDWKESFEEEIADTFIRLFDFCGNYSIDIETYINKKMDYNESREWKHGKTL